ncbi:hypothetical protein GGI15_004418 [Coemansia interrupta]|uniref:Endopeptidase S2P n=1 Tax=Coemansia interrupta TaxID=1126814 RepID=A0A9W8H3A5_9FUNG|nr:hypothetical protein GGI15_004418 [Coemansia interrupta]
MDGTQSSAATALAVFLGIWTAINMCFWIAGLLRRHASSSPASAADEPKEEEDASVSVELVSPLHLRLTTRTLNDPIFGLAQSRLSTSQVGSWAIRRYFDLGVYVALFSMVVCLGVLIYAGVQIATLIAVKLLESGILTSIHSMISIHVLQQTNSGDGVIQSMAGRELTKRSLEPQMRYRQPGSDGFQLLRPVIPGVTLPLGHIWYYLLALAICAVVHEFGHAFAAGVLGRVRLRKVGAFVMGMYPGAFVDLPREQLERQSLWTQLGVVCAGVWHNAVTALIAWLLVYSGGLGWLFTTAGWSYAGDGVVVVDVKRSSPLYGKIPLLSTVYQIDDVELSMAADARYVGSAISKWTSVLTTSRSNRDTADSGFCVRAEENVDDGLCCEMSPMFPLGESPDADIYCFEPYEREPERPVYSARVLFPADYSSMCFDLKTVLELSGSELRCQKDDDCFKADPGRIRGNDVLGRRYQSICALPSSPYPDGRVARIYYRTAAGEDGILVYVGSLTSLWLEVQVSSLMPRWQWVPYRLPSWVESLVQYVLSFSLAFCLLNAIPAWNLDGDHALRLVLLMIQGRRNSSVDGLVLNGDGSQDSSDECDEDASESDAASSVSGSSTSSSSNGSCCSCVSTGVGDSGNMELNPSYERIHSVATKATTVLLGWCIAGSVVLLAL